MDILLRAWGGISSVITSRRVAAPATPAASPPPRSLSAAETLDACLKAGGTPDVALVRRALAETLAAPPPTDPRLSTILHQLRAHDGELDWSAIEDGLRRWRDHGPLGARETRRLCEAGEAAGRDFDAVLAILSGDAPVPPSPDEAPADDLRRPAAHPREKAVYIADLIEELEGGKPDDLVEPLARLFAMPAGAPVEAAREELERIRTPIPGFPFIGRSGGHKHFYFLADACVRAAAAWRNGVAPVPVIALPKTASAFVTTVLSRMLDIPAGAVSLRHLHGVPAWTAFAARRPIALHDHMPPLETNIRTMRAAGCRRIVVHVRDPRQLILSMANHLVRRSFDAADGEAFRSVYAAGGLGALVDALVERQAPRIGAWLDGWIAAAQRGDIEIKVTTFERMRADPVGFFEDVLGFLAPGAPRAVPLADALRQAREVQLAATLSNFRMGAADEWRSALTPQQVHAIARASGEAFRTLYADLHSAG